VQIPKWIIEQPKIGFVTVMELLLRMWLTLQ